MTTKLIDTNILVYANNEDSEFHAVCKALVEKAVNGKIKTVVSVQNLIELYAVITDQRRVEHPLSPVKAKQLIEFYRSSHIRVIVPLAQTVDTVTKLIEKHGPKSQSVFDYFLVATMLDNSICGIYTANSAHFKHFDSIKVINPIS